MPVEYRRLIRRIREIVEAVVWPGARLLVVSRGDEELLRFDHHVAWHFPRADDGSWAGYHPAGSEQAIAHLEELRNQGGRYLLIPASSLWWRDHYPELFEYLERNATAVWSDDVCLIHRLVPRADDGFGAIDVTDFGVDAFGEAGAGAFYLQGWIRDREAAVTRLTALSPEGERIDLLERAFRYPRPGVDRLDGTAARLDQRSGFVAHFETRAAPSRRAGWRFEIENEVGGALETPAPLVVRDLATVRRTILELLPTTALPDERLMRDHVFPALDALQKRARDGAAINRVTDYGEPGEAAEISIVIPLYSRLDFFEHQLAQFVHDPEVRAAELIYVLDSPQELAFELRDWFATRASELSRMYRVPFRVVVMERPSGFAAATNAGASVAGGRLLVMLNSDVLPDRPGWLGEMRRFHDSTEGIGALGVKLLYEDDSLQHAGLYFDLVDEGPFADLWANMHHFKGFGREFPAANVARPVPAVTGACLMIERELFEQAGGLEDVYVQGDFEDSDLCLRLLDRGRENWYLPQVELYHLEGQSLDWAAREKASIYNRWLHTRRCGEQIRAVMARYPGARSPDL